MDVKARLGWIRLYEQVGVRRVVCRRCGISEVTLPKWLRRHAAEGEAGLQDRSSDRATRQAARSSPSGSS